MKYYIAIFLPYCNAVFILSISNYYLITFIILIELNIKEVQPTFFFKTFQSWILIKKIV